METNNKIKLYKIFLHLSKDGFNYHIVEYDAVEKKTIYDLSRFGDDGELINRRLKKDDLNKIDTVFNISVTNISYFLTTTYDGIEEGKEKLMLHVIKAAEYLKQNLDSLLVHIKK